MADRYRWKVLAIAVGAVFSTQVARLVISPVVPEIIDSFGISKGTLGLAMTAIGMASALTQFPSGVLGERYGERRIVIASLAVAGVGCLCLALAPNYWVFLAASILVGLGVGTYFIVAVSLLTRLFENTGQALGIHAAGAPVAGLVAPTVSAYVGLTYGWRVALLFAPLVIFPLVALFAWQVEETPPTDPDRSLRSAFVGSELRRLVTMRSTAFAVFLGAVTSFTWTGFITFFPTFLVQYRSFGTQRASLLFGVLFAISSVAIPLLGRLSDATGRDATLAFSLGTTGAGIAAFLYAPAWFVPVGATLILGIGLSWGGVLQSRIMEGFAPSDRNTGFGLVRTLYVLVGSSGSAVVGGVADLMGWEAAYGVIVLVLAVAVAGLAVNRVFSLGA